MSNFLTHLKDNYGKIMPHELLERKDIVNKTSYHLFEMIKPVFYAVKEILKFTNIYGTSYIQHQAVNISYVIIDRTGKFSLEIEEWSHMPTVQKT